MIKQGIHINAIYQHYKGDYYKVLDVARHHELDDLIVIYHKSDESGIFKSIRTIEDGKEVIIHQPFYREYKDFQDVIHGISCFHDSYKTKSSMIDRCTPRFKFIKDL